MNGWRGGATRFLSGRAVQRQSATSMTNDGSKRGVRMTGPQRVMIWLSGERGGCLRFCGFRPRFVEGPSYLPLTDPALLLFSSSLFSLFFLFSFFIYIHTPPSAISRCDSTSLTSTTTTAVSSKVRWWFRIRRHHRFLHAALIFFPWLSFRARGPPKGERDWPLLLTVANGGVNWA